MTKAITPNDVIAHKATVDAYPVFVIEAFNTLIAKNFNNSSKTSRILMDEVMELVLTAARETEPLISRSDVFKRKWMDIEPVYRAQGWGVKYDQPSYGEESFAAYYQFSIVEKR